MATIGLTARLLLAAFLAIAGVGKQRHRPAGLEMFRSLGLPAIPAAVIGLSLVELALAAGLLIPGLVRLAAASTAAVMTLFTAVLAAALLRGRAPKCACLGNAKPSPVTRLTLLRNLGLIAIAVFAYTAPYADALPHLSPPTAVNLAIGAPSILMAGTITVRLRCYGQALLQIGALESILRDVPDANPAAQVVELQRLDGQRVMLPTPGGSDHRHLLVFIHPECGHCDTLLGDIRNWPSPAAAGGPIIYPVAQANAEKAAHHYSTRELPGLLLDPTGAASRAYGINGFPAGVLINSDGQPAGEPQLGATAIRELHAQGQHPTGAQPDRTLGASGQPVIVGYRSPARRPWRAPA